jgi:putative endopeptidase
METISNFIKNSIESVIGTSSPDYKNDFYRAVNKSWLEDPANTIPPEYPRWGGFIQLHDEGLKNQIGLVQELCNSLEDNSEILNVSQRKIAAVWAASNRRFKSWDDKTANYAAILSELDHLDEVLSKFSIEGIADNLFYTQVNGFGNVFDFDKESDFANTENTVLDVKACGMSLPTRDYYLDEKFADKRELYLGHLNNVMTLVNGAGGNLSETFADDVLSFETNVAVLTMSPDQERRYVDYYTDTTLSSLQDERINELNYLSEKEVHYDEADRNYRMSVEEIGRASHFLERVYEKFDFRQRLEDNRRTHYSSADGTIRSDAPGAEQVYVWDGDSFRRMLRLVLEESNFRQYRAFLQYKLISANKAFTTQEMDEEFFDFYSRKLSGTEEQQPRDKRSINVINAFCGELMGQVYVQKYFPPDHKEMILDLIKGVRKSMRDAIEQNDWLQGPTKAKAQEKLELFGVKVGYPDVWKDYSDLNIESGDSMFEVSKKVKEWALCHEFYNKLNAPRNHDEWEMMPQTVNAYFHPLRNEIVFPAAILQTPFFATDVDSLDFDFSEETNVAELEPELILYAANCGGIAAVIAHEITHGYDDKGKDFDGNGTKVDWWTEADSAMFKEKSERMRAQVVKYSFDQTETDEDGNDTTKTHTMNPDLTMGENLADLGGLSLGLRTLNTRLKEEEDYDPLIATLYHRIFFRSFANIWRQNITDAYRAKLINLDPHAPTEFRANLVSNIDEFYFAFNVCEGDGMYLAPKERLNMW